MNDLETYTNTFLVTGQFTNNLDDSGNINLNVSASSAGEIFIAFDLNNYNYDNEKISKLYDVSIVTNNVENRNEIIMVNQDLQNSYNTAVAENQVLKDNLANLINIVEANPAQAEATAQKDLIIKLRIQLGQGKTDADFNTEYPYDPIII